MSSLPNISTRVLVDDPLCGPTLGRVVGHRDDPEAPLSVLLDGDDIAGAYAVGLVHRAHVPSAPAALANAVASSPRGEAIVVWSETAERVAQYWLERNHGPNHGRRVVVIPGARP